jgi:hypothetical protein
MRVIGSVESGGVEYEAIWASLSLINDDEEAGSVKALAVRDGEGANQTVIRRNAPLAQVEESLRQLRRLGLNDSDLQRLFNCKGAKLSQQIKRLVSSLT